MQQNRYTLCIPQQAFAKAVEHIGHTLLILEPLEHGIPLTRAWCIWEIFCTIRAGKRLTVAMPPKERSKFERMLLENFEEVDKCLARVQAEKSEAFKASDRDEIFRIIREQCDGLGVRGWGWRARNRMYMMGLDGWR